MRQDYFEKRVGSFEGIFARRRASMNTNQDTENYILDVRS
jgi:hypothetical protein